MSKKLKKLDNWTAEDEEAVRKMEEKIKLAGPDHPSIRQGVSIFFPAPKKKQAQRPDNGPHSSKPAKEGMSRRKEMIDTRWQTLDNLPLSIIAMQSPVKDARVWPLAMVRPDLSQEETCLVIAMGNGMWEAYEILQTLTLHCRWFGYSTRHGTVGCIAFYLVPPGDDEPLDIQELIPDPRNFADRKQYSEMSGYSHLHVAIADDQGEIKKWFEVPNDIRLDKMVSDIESLGKVDSGYDYGLARDAVLSAPYPTEILHSMLLKNPLDPVPVFEVPASST